MHLVAGPHADTRVRADPFILPRVLLTHALCLPAALPLAPSPAGYQALPPHISWQLDNNPAEQRVLLQISYTGRTTVDVATEELSVSYESVVPYVRSYGCRTACVCACVGWGSLDSTATGQHQHLRVQGGRDRGIWRRLRP